MLTPAVGCGKTGHVARPRNMQAGSQPERATSFGEAVQGAEIRPRPSATALHSAHSAHSIAASAASRPLHRHDRPRYTKANVSVTRAIYHTLRTLAAALVSYERQLGRPASRKCHDSHEIRESPLRTAPATGGQQSGVVMLMTSQPLTPA